MSRIWILHMNLDEFNAACGSAFTEADRSALLGGLQLGCNGGELPEGASKVVRSGFEVASQWRVEAEQYKETSSIGGKKSAKARILKYGTAAPKGVRRDFEVDFEGGFEGGMNQSPIPNPLITNPQTTNPPCPSDKRRRRSRGEVIQGFPDSVKRVVNTLGLEWPMVGTTPDGEATSQTDTAIFCQRVFEILERGNDPDILIEAARNYFQEKKKKFSAPQFFFGVTGYGGKGEAPWVGYVKLILTKRETV